MVVTALTTPFCFHIAQTAAFTLCGQVMKSSFHKASITGMLASGFKKTNRNSEKKQNPFYCPSQGFSVSIFFDNFRRVGEYNKKS
jgi:hypothetical protein